MEELKKYLHGLKACELSEDLYSFESAIRMMFTPQGREFCTKTGFPTLDFLRKHKEELNAVPGVYIDKGYVLTHDHNVIAAGNTALTVMADKQDAIYKPIAMHGASITVKASCYAVVTATEICGNTVELNDGTAKVNMER